MTTHRRLRIGAGALILVFSASLTAVGGAVALAATIATPPAPPPALKIAVARRRVAFGHDVTVTGTAPVADAGETVALQFAPAGTADWTALASTTIGERGHFRLRGRLRRSGLVRVLDTSSGAGPWPVLAGADGPLGAVPAPSAPRHVAVQAKVRVARRSITVFGDPQVVVRGKLLAVVPGPTVSLQALQGGTWHTLATASTRPDGSFRLRYLAHSPGLEPLRVRFAGDRWNTRSVAPAGQLAVYTASVASWYDDAGDTACGFHAHFGVANRTLPCGTKVAFSYDGRAVTATVDDRGPYVGGREWDLNQNTAGALGFAGVQTVWSTSAG